jgi:deoxyadenosine/deoxycytidine kinase
MTKLITVTGRPGAGKTTVAAILAEKLSEKHTVCLIDNNKDNINIYDAASSIESINLYFCLADKESCRRAIKESATELKKNLYFFSGSNELLTEDEIQILKEQDIFDYIIMDSMVEVSDDISDINVIVVNQNTLEFNAAAYHRITGSNKIIVINRYAENSEFKMKQDFKLFFCPEIIDFANGFELVLPESNVKEIEKMIERITGDKAVVKAKKKFKLF